MVYSFSIVLKDKRISMAWSEDLWDKWESLSRFSEQSIGCIERYGEFLDKRSRIELEYARKLQDLSYQFKGRIDDCTREFICGD